MKQCYYFYDCPRTGGTTFKVWCKRGKIKRVRYGGEKEWYHVPFRPRDEIKTLVPENSTLFTFTLLRNPVEHTASLYAKIRSHKHAYKKVLEGLTFEQWIKGKFQTDAHTSPDPWGFSMVRFYDPITHDLVQAIKNIESMDFVGFTDRLKRDLNLMLNISGSKINFNGPRLNRSRRDFLIKDDLRKIIKDVRSDDFKLVNYFRRKRGLPIYA